MKKDKKPLGGKAYGSIPHLIGSKVGEGDHTVHEGQHRICTEKIRDKHDLIIVQEKYDGSNVCVARIGSTLVPLVRAGYTAESSPYPQHHFFAKWANENKSRFEFLEDGERLCGEWLAQAHGIKYLIHEDPFVAFDIMKGSVRTQYGIFIQRIEPFDFVAPRLIHAGPSISINSATSVLNSAAGAWIRADGEMPEGLIYRVERNGVVDFLAKFVRIDFETGKYLSDISGKETVWNIKTDNF